MFVHTQEIPKIAQEYLMEVILPKVPTPMAKFGFGFVLPYLSSSVDNRVQEFLPAMKMLGIVDENGKIDLDKAKNAASQALEGSGGKLAIAGYVADGADIDALYEIAKRHAV